MAWTEVARVEPKERPYRVRCADEVCGFRTSTTPFASYEAACAFAEWHANETKHTVVVEKEESA
jgi:hypothetical protein